MTGTQQESVRLLTGGNYYHDLNKIAYNKDFNPSNKEELINMSNVLDESFKKFKLKDDIIAYRGMSKTELKSLLEGNIFKEFKHLSIDKEVAKRFSKMSVDGGVVVKFHLPKGTNGAYIGDYSQFKNEKEFVLNRNSKYEIVTKKQKRSGGLHLTMSEEELLMERERKVEESYKNYYDSRPELKKASDELYDLFENDKISFAEYRKRALELGKKYR